MGETCDENMLWTRPLSEGLVGPARGQQRRTDRQRRTDGRTHRQTETYRQTGRDTARSRFCVFSLSGQGGAGGGDEEGAGGGNFW